MKWLNRYGHRALLALVFLPVIFTRWLPQIGNPNPPGGLFPGPNPWIDVKARGAVCDGATDDTTALTNAFAAVAPGGFIYFSSQNLCIINSQIVISTPNITVFGSGWNTGLKAKANALFASGMIATSNAATGFTMRDLTMDGNRVNNGIGTATNSALLDIAGSNTTIEHVQFQFSNRQGVFFGDNSIAPTNLIFDKDYFHDNGGVAAGGFGTGIYGGGTQLASQVHIINNRFENNYNTVTGPGPSAGINLTTNGTYVIGNTFVNNYNVNGGQLVDGATGLSVNWHIVGNTITRGAGFGGDSTSGIEWSSLNAEITGNIITGANGDSIRVEGPSSGQVTIQGNNLYSSCTSGVGLLNTGGNASNVVITGNKISCTTGVTIQSASTNVTVSDNDLTGSTTKITDGTGATTSIFLVSNPGYNPVATTSSICGTCTSPFTYTAGHSPEFITMQGGTVSSVSRNGTNVCTSTPCMILLPANQSLILTHTGAPVFIVNRQ